MNQSGNYTGKVFQSRIPRYQSLYSKKKIDTLPDKRSFGIINEETDEMNVTGAELEKPFEKITEISPMEQVLSNIESSSINEKK